MLDFIPLPPWRYTLLGLAGLVLAVVGLIAVEAALPGRLPLAPCPLTTEGGPAEHPSRYTGSADAYAGPGPHPVVHHLLAGPAGGGPLDYYEGGTPLPEEWDAGDSPERAPLVLCEYVIAGGTVGRCDYRPGFDGVEVTSLPLVRTTRDFRLYEARTGELVAEFELEGTSGCPDRMTYRSERPERVEQSADPDELRERLRPFVEGRP
ncbi:hypothetical protein [Allonocardiopsis opalescens]|uniref:Uncharacterized protein n=1 Tax=Allonocardiopsis opalescens TaxID=1144618 RepID=A0A2T0QE11_9ACTN|nr:hypothetical protein [Allonocardiopsis opalescens]PRY02148.1 hypothetical protein CLV72_101749 [Allonocardiopsis opalescens]